MLILSRNSELNGPQYLNQRVDQRPRGDSPCDVCPGDAVTSREWRHKAASQSLSYAVYTTIWRQLVQKPVTIKKSTWYLNDLKWSTTCHCDCSWKDRFPTLARPATFRNKTCCDESGGICNPTNWVLCNISHQFQATRCKCCSILLASIWQINSLKLQPFTGTQNKHRLLLSDFLAWLCI